MSDNYEMSSVAFVEGCIGNAQEHLNRALNHSGLLGLENDCWAALYLEIGKAVRSLERARTRVVGVRTRRLQNEETSVLERDAENLESLLDDEGGPDYAA